MTFPTLSGCSFHPDKYRESYRTLIFQGGKDKFFKFAAKPKSNGCKN
jgi:hypothetical protein